MIALFMVFVLGLSLLYLLSRGKYDEFIKPVDEKRYPLKKLFPIALFILDKVGYTFRTRYDKKLLMKITEISGHKYSLYYLKIHWANKIASLLLGLVLAAFVGIGAGTDQTYIVFSVILLGSILYLADNELNERIKKRRASIQLDFPDFLNKLTLLINAGMTITKAWEKIAVDNRKESPLYGELEMALAEIKGGKSEHKAYEDFAKRCRTPEITRFISILIQNLRKGSSDMVSMLRLQANDCWEMRKSAAKRLGEEASTKMLLPMMIMFVAIIIIVAMPAVLAMQGI